MTYFYIYDGDQVGRRLEYLLLLNDEQAAAKFSQEVRQALASLVAELKERGCEIVFSGGDEVLARSEALIEINDISRQRNSIAFSLGIGKSPREALLSLMKAKALGSGLCGRFIE
jgi:hypothetical protein